MNNPTYTIASDGKSIRCNRCATTSHNLNDVREKFCSRCKIFHEEAVETSSVVFHVEEGQRQALILAVARLSVERPGWRTMLRDIAVVFSGGEMFDQFVTYAGLPPMAVVDTSNKFGLVRTGDMVAA